MPQKHTGEDTYTFFIYLIYKSYTVRLFLRKYFPKPEDGTGKRAAVQHLPAQCHGHIAAPSMYPHPKARLFEQQRCDQAHHRAHVAHDHQRDGVGDELRGKAGRVRRFACDSIINMYKEYT